MSRHKVMLISSVHPWDDPRIFYREALSLATVYDVEIHAIAPFVEESHQGIKVVGLPKRKRYARPLQWFTLVKRVLRTKPDVVHFHDPDLIFPAIFLRLFGYLLIYDVHELVSKDISTKRWIPRWLRPIAKAIYQFITAVSVPLFAGVIGASRPISGEYRHPNKAVVRNYPPLFLFNDRESKRAVYREGNTLKLIYSGSIQPSRGIVEILEACAQLPASLDYQLDIIGAMPEGTNYADEIHEALSPISDNVTIHGWLQFPAVVSKIMDAHIGLVCTQPNATDPHGSPLKLYEYMAAGIGVVVSDFKEWSPIIGTYPQALAINCADTEALANGIEEIARQLLTSNDVPSAEMNGAKRYSWSDQEIILLDLYKNLGLSRT